MYLLVCLGPIIAATFGNFGISANISASVLSSALWNIVSDFRDDNETAYEDADDEDDDDSALSGTLWTSATVVFRHVSDSLTSDIEQ